MLSLVGSEMCIRDRIATAMSANVFVWIIPGQRKVIAAMTSGEKYDAMALAIHGKRGKQRSVHNTYFTLPVIFAMLSNHYSFLYTHPQRWLILFVLMFAGALIRQFFVQRHGFHLGRAKNPWPFAAVGVALILAVILAMAPWGAKSGNANAGVAAAKPVAFAEVKAILDQRCLSCHGAQVQMKNVRLDSTDNIKLHAQNIYQQVSVTQQMPMNNATGITPEERQAVAQWYLAGAKFD
jgi:uncharacterized membrane protein